MENLKYHKILILYILIIAAGLIVGSISFCSFSYLDNDILKIPPESFSDGKNDLSYRMLKNTSLDSMVFRAYVSEVKLKSIGDDNYALLVYGLNCQAYGIYFNNTFLGSVGDMKTARSNIWNSMNCFFIDKNMVQQDNELRIEMNSLYDIGLSSMPIYIVDISNLNKQLGRTKFFTEGINLISIGLTIFSSIIVFLLFWISTPRNTSYLYFSAALFFLAIFTLDYTTFYSLPFSYFTYKKLIFLALYLSVAAASMGIYKFFHHKTDMIIAIVTIVGIIFFEIVSKDMITFKNIYNYYNVIIIINILSWLHTTYKNLKKSEEAKMFFIGNILFLLFAALDVYRTISGHAFNLSTLFIYAFIFSMISIILFFSEHLNKEKQLYSVNIERKKSYEASITDGMTELYNRAYMTDMMKKATPPYSVVMLDIDNLKKVNDSFGHRYGDAVICHVASNLKKNIRSNDLTFRYGGDEFFAILFGCTAESAKKTMMTVVDSIEANCLEVDGQAIPVTLSGGVYYVGKWEDTKSIFDKVDSSLYHSKNKGKNEISIYISG